MINWNDTWQISVKTLFGFETLLASELETLDVTKIKVGNRVVKGHADLKTVYRVCLNARLAMHVYIPLHSFKAQNENDLFNQTLVLDWENLIDPEKTLAVDSTVHSEHFKHDKYASLKLKDAIVDRIRNTRGRRPSIDIENPDFQIYLHISDNQVNLFLDAAGDSLHKREYRTATVAAPLNEVLAAGLIKTTGWTGQSSFLDPMCGSGTLAIEAALIARNIPAGWFRERFGFMNWPSFIASDWEEIKEKAREAFRPLEHNMYIYDRSSKAISIAEYNLKNAGLDKWVKARAFPFEKLTLNEKPGLIVMNPPYGHRMQQSDSVAFYKMIGDRLKRQFSGWEAWIVSSNFEAMKFIGLRPARKLKFFNGPLEVQYANYELFTGDLKQDKKRRRRIGD